MIFTKKYGIAILGIICLPFSIFAQDSSSTLDFSGQFYFSYERIFNDEGVDNSFDIRRGYITFKKEISPRVNIRFTQDVSVDGEGDGEGNIELRLKYALVQIKGDDVGFLTNPNIEVGVVRRPWLDFEQSINDYRAQESMFLDQNGILSSADYGLTLNTLLGGEVDQEFQDNVQSSNPGRYGSASIGVYNGGGYAALEKNNNKMIEGRLSLRPLPDGFPGFQTSFFGAVGKGNIPENPDFNLAATAVSYEAKSWITVLQGFTGTGDGAGQFVDPFFMDAIELKGWSLFTELKPFEIPVSLIFRADEIVNRESDQWWLRQGMAGVSYVFANGSKIIMDVNRNWRNDIADTDPITRFEIVTEVRF